MQDDEGCFGVVGIVIAGFAVGVIHGAAYGALAIGCGLLGLAVFSSLLGVCRQWLRERRKG